MCLIATTPPAEACGDVWRMYLRQQGRYGYVPNYALPRTMRYPSATARRS